MMQESVIVSRNLTRRFGDLTAVDSLSIEVHRGEIFGFLGHNGAGKTTTIRLLNGVLEPTGGSARVLGYDTIEDGPTMRQHTGVLTESASLEERLTARQNLTFYASLYGVSSEQIPSRVQAMLETFELADRAAELVGGFSTGMKQRLALARALLHEPELLFLDEPTSGLDPIAARSVRELIRRLSQEEGRTIFLTTHNLTEAQRLCHRVAVLEHGRLLALGTPAELGKSMVTTQRVEIEIAGDSVDVARDILHQHDGVTDVSTEAELITAQIAGRSMIPEVLGALHQGDVPVYRVVPLEPTLEDIYFALHGESSEQ